MGKHFQVLDVLWPLLGNLHHPPAKRLGCRRNWSPRGGLHIRIRVYDCHYQFTGLGNERQFCRLLTKAQLLFQ